MTNEIYDCAVVGGGPTGLTCALALASSGLQTVVITGPTSAQPTRTNEGRTAALFGGSISLLKHLDVWPRLGRACALIRAIRIIDGSDALFRAPAVDFSCEDVDEPALGFNVPHNALLGSLEDASDAVDVGLLSRKTGQEVQRLEFEPDNVRVHLGDGTALAARMVVGADGQKSICRSAAGISIERDSYGQSAVICRFSHSGKHDNISTEFHRPAGPLTIVPLPENQSSLVWVESSAVAERLATLSDDRFGRALEENLHGCLGAITDVSDRAIFPLGRMIADTMARRRVALVGESGHAIPPIGAQGLNLSFRDVAVLADVLMSAKQMEQDLGSDGVLQRYDSLRASDIRRRGLAVHLLNRSLTSQIMPIQLARGVGLHLLNASPFLRAQLIREGLQPAAVRPRLMEKTFGKVATGFAGTSASL